MILVVATNIIGTTSVGIICRTLTRPLDSGDDVGSGVELPRLAGGQQVEPLPPGDEPRVEDGGINEVPPAHYRV